MTGTLVTGFEAFGEHAVNPSAELARSLAAAPERAGEVLPVSYARAAARIRGIVAARPPRALLVLGLCADARGLRLEQLARNLDESPEPDNDGVVRCGRPIVESGPPQHPSSLPLAALAARLERERVPVEWSRDAGGFVCNHVFYSACHAMASAPGDSACGLIHVPPFAVLALDRQLAALAACLELLERGPSS